MFDGRKKKNAEDKREKRKGRANKKIEIKELKGIERSKRDRTVAKLCGKRDICVGSRGRSTHEGDLEIRRRIERREGIRVPRWGKTEK